VLNEVLAEGTSPADEFVEVFNGGGATSLASYTLRYLSATGTRAVTLWTGASDARIEAGGYFVIGSATFRGPKQATLQSGATGALKATEGAVALYDGSSRLVSALSWGSGTRNAFVQGAPAAAAPSGKTVARIPNGADTGNHGADARSASPTPGAENTR
jgi:hypothetical protein